MARTVLITGVSSGIGWGLARAYLRLGWEVYGVSRRRPQDIQSLGFHFRPLDLQDFEAIGTVLRELLSPVDTLDLAILNAGILGPIADISETPVVEMERVMRVNLWANKVLLDELFNSELQIKQVVATSSGAAVHASRGWNAYSVSKAALNMLVALYAPEEPETHFSALAPGIVDTPMQAEIPDDPRFADSLERLRQARGTPFMPTPDQVADRLIAAMEKALKYPSGSFLDLNTLVRQR